MAFSHFCFLLTLCSTCVLARRQNINAILDLTDAQESDENGTHHHEADSPQHTYVASIEGKFQKARHGTDPQALIAVRNEFVSSGMDRAVTQAAQSWAKIIMDETIARLKKKNADNHCSCKADGQEVPCSPRGLVLDRSEPPTLAASLQDEGTSNEIECWLVESDTPGDLKVVVSTKPARAADKRDDKGSWGAFKTIVTVDEGWQSGFSTGLTSAFAVLGERHALQLKKVVEPVLEGYKTTASEAGFELVLKAKLSGSLVHNSHKI